MKEKIKQIILKIIPTYDADSESKLYTDKIINSMDLIGVIAELENEFNIEINMSNIVEDNFNSIDEICKLVEKLINEKNN